MTDDEFRTKIATLELKLANNEIKISSINLEIDKLDTKLNNLDRSTAVSNSEFSKLKTDITEIKGGVGWAVKLIIGALIVALVGFIVKGGIGA